MGVTMLYDQNINNEQFSCLKETYINDKATRLPKISIITPCLNQAKYLNETINSIITQSYPNLEYIVIDGGSNDGCVDIIRQYESHLSYWVSEKDRGQVDAITKGMEKASGDIVNWLNADDYLYRDGLWKLAEKWLEVDDDKCVLCGDGFYLDDERKLLKSSKVKVDHNKVLPMAPPYTGGIQASWFLSRNAWLTVGGLNPNLNYTMDTDLFYRCNMNGIHFYPVNAYLAVYRKHENTKTLKGWKQSLQYKERFYYGWLSQLPEFEKGMYAKRVRRSIFGFYKNSLTKSDTVFSRINKLTLALKNYPEALVQPDQIKQFFTLLFR